MPGSSRHLFDRCEASIACRQSLKETRDGRAIPVSRDVLYFLAQSFRAHTDQGVARRRKPVSVRPLQFFPSGESLVKGFGQSIGLEIAQLVVARDEDGTALPGWFLSEVVRICPDWWSGRVSRKRKGGISREPTPFDLASARLRQHPLFAPLTHRIGPARSTDNGWAADSWLWVSDYGVLRAHPTRVGSVDEWIYVLAHGLLHFGFGHLVVRPNQSAWNVACDYAVARFLADLNWGKCLRALNLPPDFPVRTEESLYQKYVEQGIPATANALGTAGVNVPDMLLHSTLSKVERDERAKLWREAFAEGLVLAVTSAVNVAGGAEPFLGSRARRDSRAERARQWFINSYPLLGAMAASFTVYEDPQLCQRMAISVAAVHEERREIYINPAAGLSERECRFVMAHELLHVGLRHTARSEGRDHFLWNVACDYIINGWLIEMEVGDVPTVGLLHDPALKGESAESVYDRIATNLRVARRLCTLRGIGRGDMLEPSEMRGETALRASNSTSFAAGQWRTG